jgi:tape measure domain-containing protein
MKVYEYIFKLTDQASGPMQKLKRLAGQNQQQLTRLQKAAGGFGTAAVRAFTNAENRLRNLQQQTRRSSGAFSELKGQVAGFLSAWAAYDLARSSLETAANFQSMSNAIVFASGSSMEAQKNMSFLNQMIDSLGMSAMSTFDGFKVLAGSMKDTILEGQGTRAIFQAVATASTAMGLSADQSQGALIAIGQIMSKGKVQAEELRGQLGERIPGAFQIAARAMNMTTAELDKFMSDGKLTAEQFLPAFANELQRTFVDGAATAATGLRAAMNRAGNTMLQVKDLIGTQLAPVIVQLSEKLFQAAHWMKENWSAIMRVGEVALWAIGIFTTFKLTTALLSGGISLLTTGMHLAKVATLLFTGQFAALNVVMSANPIGLVAAGITALIGVVTWAYQKFDWFKGGIWGLWDAFKEVFTSIGSLAKEIFGGIATLIAGIFSGNFAMAKGGLSQLGDSLGKFGSNVAGAYSRGYDAALVPAVETGPKIPKMPEFNLPQFPGVDPALNPFQPQVPGTLADVAGAGTADKEKDEALRQGMEAITGGGKRVTNITINNPKVAENMNLDFATVTEGVNDIERKFKEMLAKTLNDFNRNAVQ